MPQDAIRKLVAGEHLTDAEATRAVEALMDGKATASQMGALLVALRMKGETAVEVAAFARSLRARAVQVRPRRTPLLDTCGTGGSAFRVFNVSTAAAFVAAAAGAVVAKHGNRAMSGVCGSADVLEALGVRIDLTPQQCADCIDEVGVGFLFAPSHHPAMKQVGPTRREIGVRSIFNLVGPLANPAAATRQVMGVYDGALCGVAARALKELGSEQAIVVHGEIGLDEISTIGRTRVSELRGDVVTDYVLSPADLGFDGPEPRPEYLAPLATPAENAALLREALGANRDGEVVVARRNLIAVNAAACLRACGLADGWPEAVRLVTNIMVSGQALSVLDRLVAFSRSLEAV